MDLKLEYTDKEITPWGGMALMKRLVDHSGIKEYLGTLALPEQGSNRGYDPIQLIVSFMVSVWCGASRFEHLEVTRFDKVISEIFGWERMAGHKAFSRYMKKFSQKKNNEVFMLLFQWFFQKLHFDNCTLDVDSSVFTRYGMQEGATVGYNPTKPGRNSHHPLMAFIADWNMVANFWLRMGNSYTSNNVLAFLEETLERLGGKTIGLLRGDSGFFDQKTLNFLENREKPIAYIIAVKLYPYIQREIISLKQWLRIDRGIEIAEMMYTAPGSQKARRMIVVRQEQQERPTAGGKTLRLFDDESLYQKYRYSCYVTSLELPMSEVWRLYRGRGDAENRIKELKYDFAADSFNMKEFYATEGALQFVMMAYNLMSLFRHAVLKSATQPMLKTLRYRVFGVSGYIVKRGNARVLKLALTMKRRVWFNGLWSQSRDFPIPPTPSS